jgi:hypothetical protein
MKRYLLASLLTTAALALSAGAASAKTFGLIPHHFGHCNRCGSCVAQPNAFTPICYNFCCGADGGCGWNGGGAAGCDGCAPGANYAPSQPPAPPTVQPPQGLGYGNVPQLPMGYGYPPQAPMGYGFGPQAPALQQLPPWAAQMPYNPYNFAAYNRGWGYGGMMPMNPPMYGNVGGR